MADDGNRDYSAGAITLGMVSLAVLGGLTCALMIAWRYTFGEAVDGSPLYLAWSTLVTAQGAVAWSGFLPTWWTVGRLLVNVQWNSRLKLAGAVAAVIAVLVAYSEIVATAYRLNVPRHPALSTR